MKDMLTLNLIRHAKTEQIVNTGSDFDRELLPKGIAQANLLGAYCNQHHINLGKILCSSAKRTTQTATTLCQHVPENYSITFTEALYLASHSDILSLIQQQKTVSHLTVIGHNEGISELAGYFSDEYIHLRTAEMISFEFSASNWEEVFRNTGIITLLYRPTVFLPE